MRIKINYLGVLVLLIIAAGTVFYYNNDNSNNSSPTNTIRTSGVTNGKGETIFDIGLDRTGFTPKLLTVPAGKSVTLRNDGTLGGCGLYVIQPELGINANFANNKEYTFIPKKKGTFTYTCSMGMYKGTIKVV